MLVQGGAGVAFPAGKANLINAVIFLAIRIFKCSLKKDFGKIEIIF